MNEVYGQLAQLFERIAKLSPERRQLLELLLEQEQRRLLADDRTTTLSSDNGSLQKVLYQLDWKPLPPQAIPLTNQQQPQCWLIFVDRTGVGHTLVKQLESQGDAAILVAAGTTYERLSDGSYIINPEKPEHFRQLLKDIGDDLQAAFAGVVHLWSLDENLSEAVTVSTIQAAQIHTCGSTLHLVQALTQMGWSQLPRLWLVTQGAVSIGATPESVQIFQSPLWGLGRVIPLEHPELPCVCLDLPSDDTDRTQILLRELLSPDQENQVAWWQGVRHGARLVPYLAQPIVCQSLVKGKGSYLITGGLGGLGLKLAEWLVEQGAGHLVLTGRREPSPEAQVAISELEQRGAKILVITADVSNPDAVVSMLETVKATFPPLHGLIHSAGVLDDGVLQQLTWERFDRVMAPKILGAWNLHVLTQEFPLDFFVCFSSITSVFGAPGQGNYVAANAFLDALAAYRRSQSLPALTVNWGPWAEVGMAARMGSREQNRLAAQGLERIAPDLGLQLLADLLRQAAVQVSVAEIDWSKFLYHFPSGQYPPLFNELATQLEQHAKSEPTAQRSLNVLQQLETAIPDDRQKILITYLQDQATKLLGLAPANRPQPHQSLSELGLDSLMGVQLRNRIRTELQVDLSLGKLIEEASVAQLASMLLEQLTISSVVLSAPASDLDDEELEVIRL